MSKRTNIKISHVVLAVIGLAGILAVAAIAPNAIQALTLFGFGRRKYHQATYTRKVLARLEAKGLIRFQKNRQGILCARLTSRGENELKKYQLGQLVIKKPKKWDGKWRVIIFDIKEWKRGVRDELRGWLERLGFVRLQNSVWVFPYECEDVVALLKSYFRLGREVLYITAEQVENDRWLKKQFGIKFSRS